jgi:hypothetical protein
MGNTNKHNYESEKILGQIHRVVLAKERELAGPESDRFLFFEIHAMSFELDPAFLVTGRDFYRKSAAKSMRAYNAALFSLLKHLDVFEEMQVLGGFLPRHMRTKRGTDEQDRILDQVRALKEQYWNVFWDEFSADEASPTDRSLKVRQKASAWYCCAYEKLAELKTGKRALSVLPLFSFPWVVYGVLCEIKAGSKP